MEDIQIAVECALLKKKNKKKTKDRRRIFSSIQGFQREMMLNTSQIMLHEIIIIPLHGFSMINLLESRNVLGCSQDQYGVGQILYDTCDADGQSFVRINEIIHVFFVVVQIHRCFRGCVRMEKCRETKISHKKWRRIAKRERRRRLRREEARQRDDDEKQLRAALERSAGYLKWREEEERREKEAEAREQQQLEENERQWLEEEVRAQREWQALQQQKEKEEEEQLERRIKAHKELAAKQDELRKKEEERRRKRKEELQKWEQLQEEIDKYIDNEAQTPTALREISETQPGKNPCPFFTKTGACRFGDKCSKNHRSIFLGKVILIPGFYSHFSLEKNSAEYDTDVTLEYENSETWQHFREFYEDIITELKSYGRIRVLRCCCNTEAHLRGNLYVEYYTEREATKAWRNLNGRWYAGKQLRCEFANLTSWRSAICGMNNCPKGQGCNFLHTFRNPRDEYGVKNIRPIKNTPQTSSGSSRSVHSRKKSRWEESVRDDDDEPRNWRWSESPEIEIEPRSKGAERKHSRSTERERSQRFSRNGKYERSERSSVRSSHRSRSPEEYRRSSRKKSYDDEETTSNGHSSRRHKRRPKKKSDKSDKEERRKREEDAR